MKYVSTRGGMAPQPFSDILLEGLAPDGGLALPETIPQVSAATLESWRSLGYAELAAEILGLFIDDIPADDLLALGALVATALVLTQHFDEQLLAGAEIVQQCRVRDADRFGDGAQRCATGPLVGEDLDRTVEDLLASGDAFGIGARSSARRHRVAYRGALASVQLVVIGVHVLSISKKTSTWCFLVISSGKRNGAQQKADPQ